MPQRSRQRPPQIGDVAGMAGVSRQTVSNALNVPEKLRPDTLQRVLTAVHELGYQPNRAARSLRRRQSMLVGLRINPARPDRAGSLLDRFLHALVEHSRGSGYHILPFTPGDPEDEISGLAELLGSTAVDAFILTETRRDDVRVDWLVTQGAPFVAFGRPWGERRPRHAWVDVDGAAGTAMAVDHLVDRGHRRIGFLGWSADSDLGKDRHTGWATACQRHGADSLGLVAHCLDNARDGAAAAAYLLDLDDPPTALVCASDTLALGALATLGARGLRPGRQVAVTGFDDSPTAAVIPLGLTSVHQPLEAAAEAIVKRLDGVLSGTLAAGLSGLGQLLIPSLAVRGTT
ncbi:MAG: LacI family DNA-binding transcriptional regulator [Nocardioidaceae bacterium]